jgi:tRNA threonylcarbamoyladenosine biosynthesis protein TsaB
MMEPVQTSGIGQSGNWLILDASHPRLQVVLLPRHGDPIVAVSGTPAVEGLIAAAGRVVHAAGITFSDVNGYVYCSGPGSILGIRLTVMAIRSWQILLAGDSPPVWHYDALSLAGWGLDHLGEARKDQPYRVVSEWRKDQWNGMRFLNGCSTSQIEIWDTQTLQGFSEPTWLLPQKKAWTAGLKLPEWSPQVVHLAEQACAPQILAPAAHWPIYSPGAQDYRKWSGDRHRKPEA